MYICSNGVKTAVILRDTMAESPRDPGYQDNITNMVCWHSRHNLGDKHEYKEPHDFAVAMVEKYLKPEDVFRAMANGELADFRLIDNGDNGDYSVESRIAFGPGKGTWERMDWKVSRDFEVVEAEDASFDLEMDVLDNCWPDELVRMCEKYGDVAVLPLYLYDHSGLSMSTGSFVGRAQHAQWDSGQVGYIYMDKETAMKELAMPTDEVRLAMPLEGYQAVHVSVRQNDVRSALDAKGFSPVRIEDLVVETASEQTPAERCATFAREGMLYKKNHKVYALEENLFDKAPGRSFTLHVLFSYNCGYQPLTEENWRARAEQILEADVVEFDNYLKDEVYGFKCFEGMKEVDSCWGFNPGEEDIEDLMNEELRGWFGANLELAYDSDEDFDIEEYFENNDFPELRGEIRKMVESQLHHTAQKNKGAFPYAMTYEDICWNKNGVLEDVIESLYEEHRLPSEARIHEAFQEHAGISREYMPKLRAEDLETGRDYTVDELVELARAKAQMQGQDDATKDKGKGHEIGM